MYYIIFIINLYCLLTDCIVVPSVLIQQFIVGGKDVWNQFPYVAALYYNNQYICTSTIISNTTVLTAAHCVVFSGEQQPANLFYAIANINRTAPQYRIEFSRIIVSPGYMMQNLDDDVAVMKTTSVIPLDGEFPIRPVCLAGPKYFLKLLLDKRAVAVGWGKTSNDDNNNPEILHYADQLIIKNFFCGFVNEGINEGKLCAKGLFSGICNGDSGGPLVSNGKPPVQIGIASYINSDFKCGQRPGVFTRVSKFTNFIKAAANDSSICIR